MTGSFLTKFAGTDPNTGARTFGAGAATRAQEYGYSPKQIAVALTQGGHGLTVGEKWAPGTGSAHYEAAISSRGNQHNWLHNYQNPSGAIGWEGLMRALSDGRTPEEMITAGQSGLMSTMGTFPGHTASYFPEGIVGYGEAASEYLSQFLKKKKPNRQDFSAPTPMNAPEPPGSRYGGADLTSGYTAKGLASPQPENYDNTRGGTREAFGRSKKRERERRQRVNPAMMINPIST